MRHIWDFQMSSQCDVTIDLLKHNLKLKRIACGVQCNNQSENKRKEINDETDGSWQGEVLVLSVLAKGLLFVFLFMSQRELRQYPTVYFNQINAAADNGPMRGTLQTYIKEITVQQPMNWACVGEEKNKEMNRWRKMSNGHSHAVGQLDVKQEGTNSPMQACEEAPVSNQASPILSIT